jgi:hypothetical protein
LSDHEEKKMKHKGLNQLLCAAVVNRRFCETLLHDPARAIADGYQGYTFALAPDERDLLLRIHARQLEDLAAQVHDWITGNGQAKVSGGNGHKKYGHTLSGIAEPIIDLYRAPLAVRA